jgi:hypothetical protein
LYQLFFGVERGAGSEEQEDFLSPKMRKMKKFLKKSLIIGAYHATNPGKK